MAAQSRQPVDSWGSGWHDVVVDGTLGQLADTDLLYLTDVLAAGADRVRMLRVLREDEEILRAMLADQRLFDRISSDPQTLLRVSPRLLFCVLLTRVKKDLERLGYTVERNRTVVFDGPQVASLLGDKRIADYLVELLASFVRVQSTTLTVRLRRGVWRRYRFSDLDVMGLIRYTATLEEAERFAWYRRIGDLCLFLSGVFPDSLHGASGSSAARGLSPAACVDSGRNFYRAAARHPRADATIVEVLARLAEVFELAVKPLDHLASRYLGSLRDRLFDPQ
jgi:hypothetical protein